MDLVEDIEAAQGAIEANVVNPLLSSEAGPGAGSSSTKFSLQVLQELQVFTLIIYAWQGLA